MTPQEAFALRPENPERQGVRRNISGAPTSAPQRPDYDALIAMKGREFQRENELREFRQQQLAAVAQQQGLTPEGLRSRNAVEDNLYGQKRGNYGVRELRPGMPVDSFGGERGGFWRGTRRVTDGNLNYIDPKSAANVSYDRYTKGGYDQPYNASKYGGPDSARSKDTVPLIQSATPAGMRRIDAAQLMANAQAQAAQTAPAPQSQVRPPQDEWAGQVNGGVRQSAPAMTLRDLFSGSDREPQVTFSEEDPMNEEWMIKVLAEKQPWLAQVLAERKRILSQGQ